MIELHERLSEFSYGYGVTREVEALLAATGIRTVPFLPSLLQEAEIGFDVGFSGRGVPLLLQFKLGQSLTRFVRSDVTQPPPVLDRPFYRFSLNTAEPDGQYETLLRAEMDGAEVYYVAPRFVDWSDYLSAYELGQVLDRSVMVTPREIRDALVQAESPDGRHRVVYDDANVHICSEPGVIEEVRPNQLAHNVVMRVREKKEMLGDVVRRLHAGLDNRAAIRREQPAGKAIRNGQRDGAYRRELSDHSDPERAARAGAQRAARLERLRARSRSELDALSAEFGFEFWGLGIQLIFAVEDE